MNVENLTYQAKCGLDICKQQLRNQFLSKKSYIFIVYFFIHIIAMSISEEVYIERLYSQFQIDFQYFNLFKELLGIFIVLVICGFSSSNTICKEFQEKTIMISMTLPTSKSTYILSKFIADMIYIIFLFILVDLMIFLPIYLVKAIIPNFNLILFSLFYEIYFSLFYVSMLYMIQIITKSPIYSIAIVLFYHFFVPLFLDSLLYINNSLETLFIVLFMYFFLYKYHYSMENSIELHGYSNFNYLWVFLPILAIYTIIFLILSIIILKNKEFKIQN